MAQVQMPDGQVVEMPDQIDPALGARLRAFHDAAQKPAEPGVGDYLKGAGEAAVTGASGLAKGIVGAPVALVNRLVAAATGGNGALAADTAHDFMDRHFGYTPTTPIGKEIVAAVQKHLLAPVGGALNAAGGAIENGASKVGIDPGFVHNQLQEAGELAGTVPIAQGIIGAARASGEAAAAAAANSPEWAQAGFRTAEGSPIASGLAGSSGKQALTLHNQQIGNTIASAEAGVPHGTPLSYQSLENARAAPNAVYSRVASTLPTAPLNPNAQAAVRAAGGAGQRITEGTPDAIANIAALRSQLLAPDRAFTGDQVINEMRGLRQEGYTNIGSDDVSKQQLGQAQLDMSRGLEQHVADNLPPGAPVSADQLGAARVALAKNHAVQGALRGNDVDMGAIARIQRADPDLLTGGLKTTADFANENPPVSGLASRAYDQPSIGHDIGQALGGKVESLLSPAFWTGVGGGKALARKILTGNTDKAVAGAQEAFPGRLGNEFEPLAPPANLTLSQPPGQAFEPNQPQLATGNPQRDFFGTGTGGMTASAPSAPPAAAAGPPGQLSLADLLSHGVEQSPSEGLSLAPEYTPQHGGVPFKVNAGHAAGPLSLADDLIGPAANTAPKQNTDVAPVMSQGVPEGTLMRAPQPRKVNKRDVANMTLQDRNAPTLADLLGGPPGG